MDEISKLLKIKRVQCQEILFLIIKCIYTRHCRPNLLTINTLDVSWYLCNPPFCRQKLILHFAGKKLILHFLGRKLIFFFRRSARTGRTFLCASWVQNRLRGLHQRRNYLPFFLIIKKQCLCSILYNMATYITWM